MTTEQLIDDYRRIADAQVRSIADMNAVPIVHPQRVWLLWHNDSCLGVLGSYDAAWQELHDLMESLTALYGCGPWHAVNGTKHLRWTDNSMRGCRLEIEPREVVG